MMKLVFVASFLASSNAISRESEFAGPAAALLESQGQAGTDMLHAIADQGKETMKAIAEQGQQAQNIAGAFFGQAQKLADKATHPWDVDHTKDSNKAAVEYLKKMDEQDLSVANMMGENPFTKGIMDKVKRAQEWESENDDTEDEYKNAAKQAGAVSKAYKGVELAKDRDAAQAVAQESKKSQLYSELMSRSRMDRAEQTHREIEEQKQKVRDERKAKKEEDSFENFMADGLKEDPMSEGDKFLDEQAKGVEKLRLEAVAQQEAEDEAEIVLPRLGATAKETSPVRGWSHMYTEEGLIDREAYADAQENKKKLKKEKKKKVKAHKDSWNDSWNEGTSTSTKTSPAGKTSHTGNFHARPSKKVSLSQVTEDQKHRESIATMECSCMKYGHDDKEVPHGTEKLCESADVTNGIRDNKDSDYCVDDMPGWRGGYSLCTTGRTACLVPVDGLR